MKQTAEDPGGLRAGELRKAGPGPGAFLDLAAVQHGGQRTHTLRHVNRDLAAVLAGAMHEQLQVGLLHRRIVDQTQIVLQRLERAQQRPELEQLMHRRNQQRR